MKNRTFSRLSVGPWLRGMLVVFCLPLWEAGAGITHWTGGAGDGAWTSVGNWSLGVPAITNNTYIGSGAPGINNASVTISGGDQESWQIYIGHAAGKTGTVTMTGGTLTTKATTPASPVMFVGNSGNGTFIQNGGVVSNLDLQPLKPYLSIGHAAGSVGRYELNSGILAGFSHLGVGYSGKGTFIQGSGSTNAILYLMMPVSGGHGTYTLNGGKANFGAVNIGNGMGILNQNAGEFISRDYLRVGMSSGGTGIYTMVEGSLTVSNRLTLGAVPGSYGRLEVRTNATATLRSTDLEKVRIGDGGTGPATGILMLRGGTVNVPTSTGWIYLGDASVLDDGSIQGWGTLDASVGLYFGKKARVVADGFGSDHVLSIRNLREIASYNPADTTNGWYAQNRGAVQLPGLPVTGNGIKYWGGVNSSSLVNTVTLNLAGVTGSGSLTGSLYAVDHGDVPAYAAGAEVAGVWNFMADGFTIGASTLSFRYNTLFATNSSGLVEGSMRPYRHNGTAWELLPDFGVNTTRKLVIASNVTGFGWFAVAESMTHRAPLVNAGPPQTVNVTGGASLQGFASDDGLPGALATVWSKHSGPGTVNFGNANVTNTTAGFSVDGTYVLRLTATDSDLSRFSDVEIIVTPASGNIAPVVDAGINKTVSQKLPAALEGSMTDDGLPDGSLIATWSKVSGPGTVTFADASLTNTAVTFSRDGVYVLELSADDSELSSSDTVSITVTTAFENKYWTQGGADSNWLTSANWSTAGEPTSVDYAYLGHNSYAKHARVTINQQEAEFSRLYMGHDAGTTGEVVMAGGTLTANHPTVSPVMFVGLSGVGRFIQNGGVVSNLVLGALTPYLSIGHNAGSSGRYELNGGILTGFSHLAPGNSGEGTFIQGPGTTNTCLYLMLPASGSRGTYIMNGGYANFGAIAMGNGLGVYTQYAGEVVSRDYMRLGRSSGGTGLYTIVSGSLTVSNLLTIGAAVGSYGLLDVGPAAMVTCRSLDGLAALRVGNAGNVPFATGILRMRGGTVHVPTHPGWAYIGDPSRLDDGVIHGWGVFNAVTRLYFGRKARIVADGFGEDRTLDVQSYSAIDTYSNPPDTVNGWYAQNGGKLLLQGIPVAGNGIKYWGGNNTTSLVNTVTWDFSGVMGNGVLTGALHAVGRDDVPDYAPASSVLGIWEFGSGGFDFTNAVMTIRYDAAEAARQGLLESGLRVYRRDVNAWIALESDEPDTTRKLITAHAVSDLGFFALGNVISRMQGSLFLIQ